MFKDKQFRVRNIDEVLEDLRMARRSYKYVEKIFLADGDALCLPVDKLDVILEEIKKLFPECQRVSVYATPKDVLNKTGEELLHLKNQGIGMLYIGAESGSDEVLLQIRKGATRSDIIEAVRKTENAGIKASVTFISGIGGRKLLREHAHKTASMINESEPSYVGLLTLMVDRESEIYKQINNGEFELLTAEEVIGETALMLEEIKVEKPCIFRSNHASNYVSLKGILPYDKDEMLSRLKKALTQTGLIKDERFRAL